jgi:two-component system cell cycle response regulator CtrA
MRILLVEDDPTTSKSIELMLQNANLNVYATDLARKASTWPSSTTTT